MGNEAIQLGDGVEMGVLYQGRIFGGGVAQALLDNNFQVHCLRPWMDEQGRAWIDDPMAPGGVRLVAHATLRKDEWKQYDQVVIAAAQERLRAVADLYSRNLVHRIPNGLGKTVLEYEDQSDITDAEVSMDAVVRAQADRPVWSLKYLPLPVVSKDFTINIRQLAASRTTGAPLDTTSGELSARKVAEKVESMLITGLSTYTFGGGTIYGYLDFPYRTSVTLNAHWNDSAANGSTIIDDVLAMKQASINDGHFGPWILYVPTNFERVLDEDYQTNYGKTIRQRILEIDGISEVKVLDKLPADNVVLVQMTGDTARMVEGLAVTTIQWDEMGGLMKKFKVMAIMVPQLRGDQNNRSGIVHGSK